MAEHKETKKPRYHKCPEYGCKNPADVECKYCKQYFCKEHVAPKLVGTLNYIENVIKANEPNKYAKYVEDYRRRDGHACGTYSNVWNKKEDANRENLQQKFISTLDRLRTPSVEEEEREVVHNRPKFNQNFNYKPEHYTIKRTKYNKVKYNFESFLRRFLYYSRGLIRSAIIAVILTILLVFNVGLIQNYHTGSILFGEYGYIIDFFVVLFISVIINWRDKWADLISAFTVPALFGLVVFPSINSTLSFLGVFFSVFSVLYFSTLAGNVIRHENYNAIERYLSYALRGTFIIIFIIMIASAVTNQNTINSFNAALSSINNAIGSTINAISNSISGPQINGTWANQFFSGLNSYRTSSGTHALGYCPILSSFAKVRFNTMSQNYELSHYGYDQDFASYFGTIYGVAFAEEVFYPSGYTPTNYLTNIQQSAPIHWTGLIDSTYNSYGFYIAYGPNYEISGPGGSACPVTEIPGPNINIPQYFAQYGCTVQVTNQSWFVIELASSCP
jgi:uncharacterized protein YkwD